jgi:hypothetical protein
MSGKLKNLTRVAKTYNLTTKVAPVRHLFARREEAKDGTVRVKDRRLVIPDSVTICAGKLSDSLPDGVPHCPDVAAAIARREVVWVPDEEIVEAKAETSEPEVVKDVETTEPTVENARPRRRGNG